MKASANRTLQTLLALAFPLTPLAAQTAPAKDGESSDLPDPVVEAIRKFRELQGQDSQRDVSVDLTADAAPADSGKPESTPAATTESKPATTDTPAAAAPPQEPAKGVTIKVEPIQQGAGAIDPATVKLLAPFPPKPLGAIPPGWKLEVDSPGAPAFVQRAEIKSGVTVPLSVKPHVLVPATTPDTAFSVTEPGFVSDNGYPQATTVGAVLAASVTRLDEDSKQLGNAIEQLQQIVSALPKQEPKPEPKPDPRPSAKPTPNRPPKR